MGLNFYPRPPRERLDPPNRFISGALGADPDQKGFEHELLEDAVLEFEDVRLREVQREVARAGYPWARDPR